MPNSQQNSKINAAFYHSLGKVLTESTNLVGNEKYKSAHNVRSNEVWMDSIPYTSVFASASQYSDDLIVRQIGTSSNPSYLYPLSNTNYQTWFIDTGTPTPVSDGFIPSSGWIKSLISPSDVTDIYGSPSFGYQLIMYRNDGVTSISYGSAYYDVDYFSGLIRFDVGFTPKDSGNGLGFVFNKVNFENTPNESKHSYIQNISTGGPRVISWQYVGKKLSNYTLGGTSSDKTQIKVNESFNPTSIFSQEINEPKDILNTDFNSQSLGMISVYINGVGITIGDSIDSTIFFSDINLTDITRSFTKQNNGYRLFINPYLLGYDIDPTDTISIEYIKEEIIAS